MRDEADVGFVDPHAEGDGRDHDDTILIEKSSQGLFALGGGQACVIGMDVTQPASVQAAFDAAAEALGPVSVVINNAGIAVSRPALERL